MTARSTWKLSLAAALAGAALAVPAPVFGDGVEEPTPPPVSAAPPPVPRAYEPGPCLGNETIGVVVAVSGSAQAVAPGGAPRALACDDPLVCEEIVTAPGASLSFVSGEVLVRVGGDSRVGLNGSPGAPELFVERGAVRSTDARSAGAAPVRLAARDLAASAAGADLELEARAAGSRVCAYDGSAAVDAGPRARTLAAGRCLASEGGGLASFAAAEPSLGLEPAGFCAFEVALDDSLTPGDVAAPELFAFPGGDPASDIPRDPCDVPGSGCSARPNSEPAPPPPPPPPPPGGPGGDIFDDPDPVPGCDVPGVSCGG
jgi:hypothetical protein